MLVFKFGGASVKNAEAVRNVETILRKYPDKKIVTVISAMGKTTNSLEALNTARGNGKDVEGLLEDVKNFHLEIAAELGGEIEDEINPTLAELSNVALSDVGSNSDLEYDQVVCFGELLSTKLVEAFLRSKGLNTEWLDVRNVIKTDNNHKHASVDWDRSSIKAQVLNAHLEQDNIDIIVTQGFIGRSPLGNTTTLGREGSDFTAGILANLTNASEAIIWKDVPGMLNADPKWFNHAVKLDRISYREAVELSYFGASVIHPKTIKPLQNKSIPLRVKSFIDSDLLGTTIHEDMAYDNLVPSYIFKPDQTLVSISPKDFSFIVEGQLREIFQVCSDINVRINLMQNSALNFSLVIDHDDEKLARLSEMLNSAFDVKYNTDLQLLTIRHYDQHTVASLTTGNEILLEQKSRQTLRIAMRQLEGQT